MEEATQPSTRSLGVKYGLIMGLIGIVLFVVYDMAGVPNSSSIRYLGFIPGIIVLFLAHKAFKDEGDGYMSFGQGFGIGFTASLVSSLMNAVIIYVYVSFLNTDYIDNIKAENLRTWEEQGMTDAQISQAEQFSEFMMNAGAFSIMAVIFGLIGGVIMSLIVSAITKKQDPQEVI